MDYLLGSAVWAVANYFIAKKVMKHYPNLDINEWYYVAGAFIVGAFWTWIFLGYKVYEHDKTGKFSK